MLTIPSRTTTFDHLLPQPYTTTLNDVSKRLLYGCNRLQLNASKTEFLWCSSSRRIHLHDRTSFHVGDDLVQPASVVRDLGLYIDEALTMTDHINNLMRTCFGILRQLKTIRRCLPLETTKMLIHSFISSRVDYCNAAFAGLPASTLSRVQSVLNAAARLVYGARKYDHVTPLLRDRLHWLRMPERVTYKLCLLIYKCLHNLAPVYLSDAITPLSMVPSRQRLRSSTSLDLLVPRTCAKIGERAFHVAGPVAWNSLPSDVQSAESLGTFKQRLKAHLFRKSYELD